MVKKRGKNGARKFAREAFDYLVESKNYLYLATILFAVSVAVGYRFSQYFYFFELILQDLVFKTMGLSTGELMFFIFRNNVTSAFLAIVLGGILGIFPILNAMTNGILLGYVFERVSDFPFYIVLSRIIPHGVFELPAIIISIGIGMRFGMFLFNKNWKEEFFRRFKGSMKVFFVIVLPLLVIAAIIEGLLIGLS